MAFPMMLSALDPCLPVEKIVTTFADLDLIQEIILEGTLWLERDRKLDLEN